VRDNSAASIPTFGSLSAETHQERWKLHQQCGKTEESDAMARFTEAASVHRLPRFANGSEANGMVNDHLVTCFRYAEVNKKIR